MADICMEVYIIHTPSHTIHLSTCGHPSHTHIHRVSDNCYTYECKKICLALTEVFKITGIRILGTNNNEPSHGGGLADTAGAIMKNLLWKWTMKNARAIQEAK